MALGWHGADLIGEGFSARQAHPDLESASLSLEPRASIRSHATRCAVSREFWPTRFEGAGPGTICTS